MDSPINARSETRSGTQALVDLQMVETSLTGE